MQGQTIFDLAGQSELADNIVAGQSGYLELPNPRTGGTSWTAYVPIESTGWYLVLSVPANEMLADAYQMIRQSIFIGLAGIPGYGGGWRSSSPVQLPGPSC